MMVAALLTAAICVGCVDAKSKFQTDVQTKIGVVGERLETLAAVNTSVGEQLKTLADVNCEVQALGNKVGFVNDKLEKLVEQSQHASVTADRIDHLEQTMKQQLAEKLDVMHKDITAGTIHYGGAGWAVLAAGLVVLLFLGCGVAIVFVATRNAAKFKNLLTLVTSAVQQTSPEVREAVTSQIEQATSNGGPWGASHKDALAAFTRSVGTVVPKKADSSVCV
jgi:hypothetical protein